MATAKVTKHILEAYKSVRRAEERTQEKLDALLETNAHYKLFEHDEQHPYYILASSGKSTLADFEELVAAVMDWQDSSRSISEELDVLQARQIVDETEVDDDLDALRLIKRNTLTEADAAEKLLLLCGAANRTASRAETSFINYELAKLHGKRYVKRHKESPEVSVTPECRAAFRKVKKMGKVLRDCGNGVSTIREELEKKQVLRGLSGQPKDVLIEMLLKP